MLLGLAPMDGFTDCAFRQITKEIFEQYGDKDRYQLQLWTEFMNADGYLINPRGVIKHLLVTQQQAPVIAQIFGSDEKMIVQCFRDIQEHYGQFFAGIELNMWCPAKNVMNTWGWSALLKDRNKALTMIKLLANKLHIPLSIKTRTGITNEDKKQQMDFLIEVSHYVTMITVHGRTVQQWYSGEIDWDFIYRLKQSCVPTCKIIGNGAITSYAQLEELGSHKLLDGYMVGQAAIGNPRIFTPHIPTHQEIKTTILRHLDYLIAYEDFFQQQKHIWIFSLCVPPLHDISHQNVHPRILAEFRKHLFQYIKWIPWSKEFKVKVSTISEYHTLVDAIQNFFG